LHFEIRFFDLPINPELVIDFENKELVDENLFIHKGLFTPVAQASAPSSASNSNSSSNAKYHKVRKGDTLSSIARKHGTTVAKLCKLNRIKQNTTLRIGQTIRVR
jgi:LysM repeat protein